MIFVEHILLYSTRGEVPDTNYKIPLGQSAVICEGADITLIGYSRMARVCLAAAEELSGQGINAEVVDLRTLRPLDIDTVAESVKKTHRAIVVEETSKLGGFGGEIVSQVQEAAFDYLDTPVRRIAGAEAPIPYAMPLEQIAIPSGATVAALARQVMGR